MSIKNNKVKVTKKCCKSTQSDATRSVLAQNEKRGNVCDRLFNNSTIIDKCAHVRRQLKFLCKPSKTWVGRGTQTNVILVMALAYWQDWCIA